MVSFVLFPHSLSLTSSFNLSSQENIRLLERRSKRSLSEFCLICLTLNTKQSTCLRSICSLRSSQRRKSFRCVRLLISILFSSFSPVSSRCMLQKVLGWRKGLSNLCDSNHFCFPARSWYLLLFFHLLEMQTLRVPTRLMNSPRFAIPRWNSFSPSSNSPFPKLQTE